MHFQLHQQFGSCYCYTVIGSQRRELCIEALQSHNLFNSSKCPALQILLGLLKIFNNVNDMSTNQSEVMPATHGTCGHVVQQSTFPRCYHICLQILKRTLRDSSLFATEPLSQNLGSTDLPPIVFLPKLTGARSTKNISVIVNVFVAVIAKVGVALLKEFVNKSSK